VIDYTELFNFIHRTFPASQNVVKEEKQYHMFRDKSPFPGVRQPNPKLSSVYGYIVVAASFLILLIAFGINYSFGTFFNDILNELNWTRAVTSAGYSISVFVGGVMGLITGRICDRFGHKITIFICGILLALGCLLMSQVYQTWQLYIFYGLLVGMGLGGTMIPLSSTVSRWFVRRRGLMTGIVSSGIGFGTIIVPIIVNQLLDVYDWRTSFVIVAVVVIIVVLAAALFLKRDPGQIGQLAYGEYETSMLQSSAPESGLSFIQALHSGQFWIIFFIYIIFGFYLQSIMLHIVPYAKDIHIDADKAVTIMSFIGLGSIIGRIAMGGLSDRIGIKNALLIALGIMVSAFFWLLASVELWKLCLFGVFLGFADGAMIAMETLAGAKMFGLHSLGTIAGAFGFAYSFGGSIGPVITGYIFDINGSYSPAFIVCTVLTVIALVLALFLQKNR